LAVAPLATAIYTEARAPTLAWARRLCCRNHTRLWVCDERPMEQGTLLLTLGRKAKTKCTDADEWGVAARLLAQRMP